MTDASGFPIGGPVEHPHATTVLILGVVGLLCCGLTAPIAWVMGQRATTDIDRAGGYYGGQTQVRVGLVLGIVGTVLMIIWAVVFLMLLLGGDR